MRRVIAFFCLAWTLGAEPDRMQWFRNDKFGMFIHWGPYSQLAGEWKGQQIPVGSEAEWIMQRFNIPVEQYREMAHSLNPVNFDAAAVGQARQTDRHEIPGGDGQAPRRLRDVPVHE